MLLCGRTTKSAAVALDYSGGNATPGSIFVIDFDMNSRGASIQWLSQYPHEEELLFPPCTCLSTANVAEYGPKRCLLMSVQVSTNRPDTSEVTAPEDVPGTASALQWVAVELLQTTGDELAARDTWELGGRNLQAHAERLALLVGRGQRLVQGLRTLKLNQCQLGKVGAAHIAGALQRNQGLAAIE